MEFQRYPLKFHLKYVTYTLKDVLQSEYFNTLRPRQNGRHFPDNIFKCIFLNENIYISIKILLKFVAQGPINTIPGLVQIMVWHLTGNKPLSETILALVGDAYMRHSASMS